MFRSFLRHCATAIGPVETSSLQSSLESLSGCSKTASRWTRIFSLLGCSAEEALTFCRKNPFVFRADVTHWTKTLSALQQSGFTGIQALQTVQGVPGLVHSSPAALYERLNSLRRLGLSEGELQSVVSQCPRLLTTDVHEQAERLASLFRSRDVRRLAKRHPNILVDEWEHIEEKYRYAVDEMGLDPLELLRSGFLSHSLQHIRWRHLFMERSGLFRRGDPGNPPLRSIVDVSEAGFVRRTMKGRFHVYEFRVFCQLVDVEEDEEEDEE